MRIFSLSNWEKVSGHTFGFPHLVWITPFLSGDLRKKWKSKASASDWQVTRSTFTKRGVLSFPSGKFARTVLMVLPLSLYPTARLFIQFVFHSFSRKKVFLRDFSSSIFSCSWWQLAPVVLDRVGASNYLHFLASTLKWWNDSFSQIGAATFSLTARS